MTCFCDVDAVVLVLVLVGAMGLFFEQLLARAESFSNCTFPSLRAWDFRRVCTGSAASNSTCVGCKPEHEGESFADYSCVSVVSVWLCASMDTMFILADNLFDDVTVLGRRRGRQCDSNIHHITS